MPKFAVKYYRQDTHFTAYTVEIEAQDGEAARQHASDCLNGVSAFTAEEAETIAAGITEIISSEHRGIADASEGDAVTAV